MHRHHRHTTATTMLFVGSTEDKRRESIFFTTIFHIWQAAKEQNTQQKRNGRIMTKQKTENQKTISHISHRLRRVWIISFPCEKLTQEQGKAGKCSLIEWLFQEPPQKFLALWHERRLFCLSCFVLSFFFRRDGSRKTTMMLTSNIFVHNLWMRLLKKKFCNFAVHKIIST